MHKSPINPLFALCLSSAWTLRVGQRLSSAPLDYISSLTGYWCDNCVWQKVNTLIVKMNHAVLTPELCHLFKTTFRCQDLLKYAYEPTNTHFSSSVVVAWFGADLEQPSQNDQVFHPDHPLMSVKVLISHICGSLRNKSSHSDVTVPWLNIAVAQTLNNIYRSIYISAPVTCQQLQYSRWGPRIKETTSITASGSGGAPCEIRTPAEYPEDPGALQAPPARNSLNTGRLCLTRTHTHICLTHPEGIHKCLTNGGERKRKAQRGGKKNCTTHKIKIQPEAFDSWYQQLGFQCISQQQSSFGLHLRPFR